MPCVGYTACTKAQRFESTMHIGERVGGWKWGVCKELSGITEEFSYDRRQ